MGSEVSIGPFIFLFLMDLNWTQMWNRNEWPADAWLLRFISCGLSLVLLHLLMPMGINVSIGQLHRAFGLRLDPSTSLLDLQQDIEPKSASLDISSFTPACLVSFPLLSSKKLRSRRSQDEEKSSRLSPSPASSQNEYRRLVRSRRAKKQW